MNSTLKLQQSVLHDVASLLDDDEALKKLRKYIRQLRKERQEATVQEEEQPEMTSEEKQEILNDISEGIKDAKRAMNGEIKLQTIDEFLHELRH